MVYSEIAVFKRCPLIFKRKLKPLASEAKGLNVIFIFFLKPFTVVYKWQMFLASMDL